MAKTTIDGILAMHIDIRVDTREMKSWAPERIAAFFTGVALAEAARLNKVPPKFSAALAEITQEREAMLKRAVAKDEREPD